MFSTFIAWGLVEGGLPLGVALIAALALSFLGGMVIERVLIRPVEGEDPLTILIVTLGLFILINSAAGWIWGFENRAFPRALPDVDLALINTNYALEAKLDPSKDALFIEDGRKSPYANFIATRKDNAVEARTTRKVAARSSATTDDPNATVARKAAPAKRAARKTASKTAAKTTAATKSAAKTAAKKSAPAKRAAKKSSTSTTSTTTTTS